MSNHPTTTRAQKLFLRAFRDHPAGPPPSQWPAPAILSRWLENDTFRQSLAHLRDALRFQTDFSIATAAASASRTLQTAVLPLAPTPAPDTSAATSNDPKPAPTPNPAPADVERHVRSLTNLLRLAHLRQRFTAEPANNRPHSSPNTDNKKTFTPVAWNPNWYDRPDIIANSFCDPDKSRLKAYMLLLTMRGRKGFEPFLAAYPEELARALEIAKTRSVPQQPAPSPTAP
jgi:hypothetical protein